MPDAPAQAITLVQNYLDAMVKRDVPTASRYIHPNAEIVYPGGKVFKALETLSESSSAKFKTLHKTYQRFESLHTPNGTHVVYVSGTLSGTWPDDAPFENIRFIDRYEVDATCILHQEVWSDSAEFRLTRALAQST
jgi:Domain of unknown function (DUF4440)